MTFLGYSQQEVEVYNQTGKIARSGNLDADELKDGRWSNYYPKGQKRSDRIYSHGQLMSRTDYDSSGHKSMTTERQDDDSWIYRGFHPNGLKASYSDIDPALLEDSTATIDRPYFDYRFDANGLFVSGYLHVPFINENNMPYHRFHSRTRIAEVHAVENELTWYAYAGISSVTGRFDMEHGVVSLEWPEQGMPTDPAAREFDLAGKDDDRLQSFFIDGLPYGNWLNYYPNGQLWYSINFDDGLPEGEFISYYFSGQPAMRLKYVGGRPNGEVRQWHEDGSEKSLSHYEDGRPHGEWERKENGSTVERRIYDNGRLMSQSVVDNGQVETIDRSDALSPSQPTHQRVDDDGQLLMRSYYGLEERYDDQGLLITRSPLLGLKEEYGADGSLTLSYTENEEPTGFSIVTEKNGTIRSAEYSFSPTDLFSMSFSQDGESMISGEVEERYDTKAVESLFKKAGKKAYEPLPFFVDGVREGKVTIEYPHGKKWSESTYLDGLQNGMTTVWDVNGEKVAEGAFESGRPSGIHRRWTAQGQLVDERIHTDGRLHGLHRRWDPMTGTLLLSESFSNGVLDGLRTTYSPDGSLRSEIMYAAGKRNGKTTLVDSGGSNIGFVTFKEGKKEGPADEQITFGLRGHGEYQAGQRHGLWQLSSDDGERSAFFFEGRELTGSDPDRCAIDVDLPLTSSLLSSVPFADRLSYTRLRMWTEDRLKVDESQFNLLIDATADDSASAGSATIAIISDLYLECEDIPGFAFDLAPLQGIAEYSRMTIDWERKDYFLRRFPRFADSTFTGSALDYYHLGADHFTLDEPSLIQMTRDMLAENFDLDQDSATAIIYRQLISEGILSERPRAGEWPETNDPEVTEDRVRETLFILSIDADPATRTDLALHKVDDLFRPIAGDEFRMQMDRQMSQYTIDLHPEIVHLILPAHQVSASKEEANEGAVLSMRPSMLRFNTESGMSNISAQDYCFAEGNIGGSSFSLDFDAPQVILRSRKLRELISDTQDYYFYAENLGLDFKGVFAAEAWGRFETSTGEQVFLEYTNLGITDKFLAGRLKIDLPEEHSHEVFKEMEKAFTYHEIISEWDGLEIYFMRLKPKTP